MPYAIRLNGDGTVRVVNTETGAVKARRTSPRRARRMVRLLHGLERGWHPTRT
jgi:hypothetical protein